MKYPSFQGPGGECQIREPLPFRIVNSGWFLALWLVGLLAWAGYYISFRDAPSLLGNRLSPGHVHLQADCFNCHVPFQVVPNDSCVKSECHGALADSRTHNSMPCKSCHPMHTNGAFVPAGTADQECQQCHDHMAADPTSRFSPDNKAHRLLSHVAVQVFPHGRHSGPGRTSEGKKKFACFQCHYLGPKTLNTPLEDLFTMNSCLNCKYHSDKKPGCRECHNFGQPKWLFHLPRAKTFKRECVRQEEISDIRLHILRENLSPANTPGYRDLPVCETGKPSTQVPAPEPEPEAAPGSTAEPRSESPAPP